VRNSLTEISSLRAKENALGKVSAVISDSHKSFQNKVEDPSEMEHLATPLKMGLSLNTSLHQNEPHGSIA